jgi:histidinol-phosphate aminotransferase
MVITRTFSKIYGLAGLRVGYMLGEAGLLAELNKTREPFNVNMLAQTAAVAALDDVQFVARSVKNNEEGKAYLEEQFQKLGLKFFPSVANFIFVYLPVDCLIAFEKLMDLGVTIRPMKGFGEPNAIRVTIGTPEQNEFFINALKKVLEIK